MDIAKKCKVWYTVLNRVEERLSRMSKKQFSKEEIEELKQNPHVTSVSARSVYFTAEFKQIAYEAMVRGERLESVLEMYGINTGILGEVRIRGLSQRLYQFAEREGGFQSQKGKNRQSIKEASAEETVQKRLKRLENELAYTRQEVEFLKKVQAADTEARKAWESKHRPK